MTNEFYSKDLGHHGIVAAVCDQIGLVKTIDEIIPPDVRSELSIGEVVKLMIINGLGFTSRPLYLESQFFSSKPIERLLGRDIDCKQITDDRLGKSLDSCFESGCSQIFGKVATKAALQYNVDQKFRHLDTTSINVQGEYDQEEGIGLVTFGHSKDHRPDLKQFMVSLMSSKDGDIPLLAQSISGNTSDKSHFKEILSSLKNQMDPNQPFYYVADSALYTKKTLEKISSDMMWITRVPEVLKSAKSAIRSISSEEMRDVGNGYSVAELGSWYGDVCQRWLIVFSEKAMAREKKTLERNINKEIKTKEKELNALFSKRFGCEKDALAAISTFKKGLKYVNCIEVALEEIQVHKGKGRPKKGTTPDVVFKVKASLERNNMVIEQCLSEKGKFIVATNELDETKLPSSELLDCYKEQQCVERGFRFLKDPFFLTPSVFLKKQERIVALTMIMCLCLLIYTLAQRILRHRLQDMDTTLSDQCGKPTQYPTIRWIFQIFEGVHVLFFVTGGVSKEQVLNLSPQRKRILEVLGPPFQKIYEDSA
ncbi:IS1634 family transposase [Chlamydiales bacterium]|nr:IS1634 family transposase [Chlamydiales bacterium]